MGRLVGGDWPTVLDRSQKVLALEPDNAEALTFKAAAERSLGDTEPTAPSPPVRRPPDVSTPTIAAPTSFANGRYQIKELLGEGGRKRVYKAHDTVLDRDVALAVIKTEGLDPTSRARMTREAQAMARLGDHPHVLQIFDLGDDTGQSYMVLPLMPGGSVEALLGTTEDRRLPLEQAIELAVRICGGLEFAHSKGIVQRDLKPGNVWLASDGKARIGDFGLAVAIDRSRLTQEGMMVGTLSYMPPEQAMGGDVTPQSDLYSLGAMLYERLPPNLSFIDAERVIVMRPSVNLAMGAGEMRIVSSDPKVQPVLNFNYFDHEFDRRRMREVVHLCLTRRAGGLQGHTGRARRTHRR